MKSLVVGFSRMHGNGGGIFATLAYVNAMARIADETVFLFPSDDLAEDTRIDGRVRQIPVRDQEGKLGKMKRIIFRGVLHRFETCFRELLAKERFDIVTFHNSKASRHLIDLAHTHGAKVITVHNNYERDYTVDNVQGFLLPFILPSTVAGERESVRKSDLNIVLCEKDEELLRSHYDPQRKSVLGRLGVFEYRESVLSAHPDVKEPVFVITGNLSAKQTIDSLLPWLSSYWPILKGRVPEARLVVAGKQPGKRLQEAVALAGGELVDTPPDMSVVLNRGRYYVCPTCKGGGVKLRVMDGLRAGLPVLCHEVSARGYEPFFDVTLFRYGDPGSFRTALDRMLSATPDVESALSCYRNAFSFEAGTKRLEELMKCLWTVRTF